MELLVKRLAIPLSNQKTVAKWLVLAIRLSWQKTPAKSLVMWQTDSMKTITLAFTGASGLPYGIRLLECLLASEQRVHLVYTQAAQIVAKQELDFTLPNRPQDAEQLFAERFGKFSGELKVFGIQDWYAPMASGSNPGDAMVVCPCTMGTLGKIASGIGDDLIARGAVIMPPNPGFYHHPQSVQDIVDFVVARILDHLGVEQALMKPWGE